MRGPAHAVARSHATLVAAAAALALAAPPFPAPAAAQDASTTLIRDVRIVDGTGAPPRPGAVRLRGARIEAVGALTPRAGETVVGGGGLALAPGFIDTHSHHDRGLSERRDALAAVSQGITTIIAGQDGGHPFPLAELFARFEAEPAAVNVAAFAGHNTLRRLVLGEAYQRPATDAEIAGMRSLLRAELEAGALGLSTGLEYDPGIYSTTGEVIALAREAADAGGRYLSHMRSEDRDVWNAVRELIEIGRETGMPVQVSHMKLAAKMWWDDADRLLAILDSARAEGIEVTADVYPYEYWQSTMTVLLPERNFDDREAARFALEELAPPDQMIISRYELEPRYVGMTVAEVAAERGTDAVTAYMELIQASQEADAGESIIATSMATDDVVRLIQWPHTNISSDGALAGRHPRGFGAFTRVLGPFVREGHLTLEGAVHKMSGLAAAHMGITDRGVIRPGAYADLVLFDPGTVTDRATTDEPQRVSEGIVGVWVNGVPVYRDGETTGARPGRVIRR